jgi:hypothetical protein
MVQMQQVADELRGLVNSWEGRLIRMRPEEIQFREEEGRWSVKEIIGHLADSASNNHQRFVRLQLTEELSFPDYQSDNEKWVASQKYQEEDWNELIWLWKYFNLHLAHVIQNIRQEVLDHSWIGGSAPRIRLGDLILDYLAHLKMHLDQIAERFPAV